MTKHFLTQSLVCLLLAPLSAQTIGPEITSWIINSGSETGYDGLPSNVQQVRYSDDNVYVSASCIPGYDIGPWAGNPNVPANQNFVFKITRHPQPNTGNLVATPLGHIGIWSNGVSLFNAKDAMSWQNQGKWNRNAIVAEGLSFDDCLGHPAPNGEYHHHLNPTCLYDDTDSLSHSPLIGFAFDGFPIYGCFGYANTDGSGGIQRMRSSYKYRDMTQRQTLPDGTQLAANQYGPAVSSTYPLGLFLEDFEYAAGLGDLDEHNGRFTVTPEYPEGMYCYFVTLDDTGTAAYPYIIGPAYYGTVQAGNTGPQSGHNVPNEAVTVYNPVSGTETLAENVNLTLYPNPAKDVLHFGLNREMQAVSLEIFDATGQRLAFQTSVTDNRIDVSGLPEGMFWLKLRNTEGQVLAGKFLKQR